MPQAETAAVVTVMTVVRRVVATAGAAATAMGRAVAVGTAGGVLVVAAIAVQAVGGVSVPSLPETGISFAPHLSTPKDRMFLKRIAYRMM